MRYTVYIPLNAKDLTIDLIMLAYGNRQNAIKFTRANNSDLLGALKHLMETRHNKHLHFQMFDDSIYYKNQMSSQNLFNKLQAEI